MEKRPTVQQVSTQQQHQQQSPQVPRRRHIGEYTTGPVVRNLPSIPGTKTSAEGLHADLKSLQPINGPASYRSVNSDAKNNNPSSSPLARTTGAAVRHGGTTNCFDPQPPQAHPQPYQQQQPSSATPNNNNSISARLVPQPYTSSPSPTIEHSSKYPGPMGMNSNDPRTAGGAGGGGIVFDDLSPTERDLMKSVQELDRMCESSSSMYPVDSDEMSSVESYPLSKEHHHSDKHSQRPPAEGSKFSADSAYGSLSRQSPDQHQTIRRTYHHHHQHRGTKSSTSQPDAFDNSSGSESSLPPITATLKAQKMELHPPGKELHGKSPSTGSSSGAASMAAAVPISKFCHECGSRFMINTAKFCMECGVRRIMLD